MNWNLFGLGVALLELVDSLHFASTGVLLYPNLAFQAGLSTEIVKIFYLILGISGMVAVAKGRHGCQVEE